MYRGNTIAVVVPAYNEAEMVGSVIDHLPAFVDRVYAIDDCSTDDTWSEIQQRATGQRHPSTLSTETVLGPATVPDGGVHDGTRVIAIRHETNQGAGGALKTGYRHAERDEMDITVTIDADGQMDPKQMADLLDPIVEGRAAYAKGNRLAGSRVQAEMPRFRLLGNWLLTLLTRPASGYWRLRDPQNGYTAISREALSAIDLDALPDHHDYPNDLLARLNVVGATVADVPMSAVYGDEESTIDFATFVPRTSKTLLRAFVRRLLREGRRGTVGLPLLYVLGTLGLLLGLSSSVGWLVTRAVDGGSERSSRGATSLLFGVVASLQAVVSDYYRGDAEVIRE